MAGPPAVQVTGAVETQRALRRMAGSLDDPAFHGPPGEILRQRALDRVPRVSGALAETIDLRIQPDGAEVVAGSSLVPYAGVINYGWDARNIEAQPYLTGDLGEVAADVTAAYAHEVSDLVERVGRES